MGEATEKVGSDQSLRMPGVSSKALEGMPQWVKAVFLLLSMIGIPGGMVAIREVKDWRFEERRLEVERTRIEAQAKQNVVIEDLGKTLKRLEWKLPKDTANGGDR